MAKARTLVGLDVHAAKVVAAILGSETGELRFQRLGGESAPVVKLRSSLERPDVSAGLASVGSGRAAVDEDLPPLAILVRRDRPLGEAAIEDRQRVVGVVPP
jgi:hypothetical protein